MLINPEEDKTSSGLSRPFAVFTFRKGVTHDKPQIRQVLLLKIHMKSLIGGRRLTTSPPRKPAARKLRPGPSGDHAVKPDVPRTDETALSPRLRRRTGRQTWRLIPFRTTTVQNGQSRRYSLRFLPSPVRKGKKQPTSRLSLHKYGVQPRRGRDMFKGNQMPPVTEGEQGHASGILPDEKLTPSCARRTLTK